MPKLAANSSNGELSYFMQIWIDMDGYGILMNLSMCIF